MKPLRLPPVLTAPGIRRLGLADVAILCLVGGAIAALISFAREFEAPLRQAVQIDLRPTALPRYTLYSLARGVIALAISYLFALGFGWAAAKSRAAERVLLPMLDILQSIPVLGFLPGLVLGLMSLFPTRNIGLELAAILMIFTAQAWNLAFSFYNSLKTLPDSLRDACKVAGWRASRTFWRDEPAGGEGGAPATSWVLEFLRHARLPRRAAQLRRRAYRTARRAARPFERPLAVAGPVILRAPRFAFEHRVARLIGAALLGAGVAVAALAGVWQLWLLLRHLGVREWGTLVGSAALTFTRVMGAVLVSTAWALPAGVVIGRSPRLARLLQPAIQGVASFPAPLLFPLLVLLFERAGVGLGLGAVALMVLAGQWYILFNVISAVAAIPEQLKDAANAFQLPRLARWRSLYLPAAFPALVTGWVTAAGGAWNGSIVAEYMEAGGAPRPPPGLGGLISDATAHANFPFLAGGIGLMRRVVVGWDRFVLRAPAGWAQTPCGVAQ